MPDRFVMSESGARRVKRALEIVESGPQPFVQAVNYSSPATWRLAVSSCGASPGTTTTFELTRLNSTIIDRFATNSTLTFDVMDYWKWGVDKFHKMMAFRPVPDFNWYLYQPPAARYGRIKSFSTGLSFDTVVVHYANDAIGVSVDTGTTINISLVHRAGRTLDLTTGEIMAFVPDLGGGFHAISDYSEADPGTTQNLWGPAVHFIANASVDSPSSGTPINHVNGVASTPTTDSQHGFVFDTTGDLLCYIAGTYVLHSQATFSASGGTTNIYESRMQIQKSDDNKVSFVVQGITAAIQYHGAETQSPGGLNINGTVNQTALVVFSTGDFLRLRQFTLHASHTTGMTSDTTDAPTMDASEMVLYRSST